MIETVWESIRDSEEYLKGLKLLQFECRSLRDVMAIPTFFKASENIG